MSKEQAQPLPGVGVDVGTSNVVVTRRMPDGSFSVRHHRNMLFEMEDSEDSAGVVEGGDFLFVRSGGKYYVVGEDALRLCNAMGAGEVIRPMRDGMLNPSLKRSKDLLLHVIRATVGKPVADGECLRFCVPANPVDVPDANNAYHQAILGEFFTSLGYSTRAVNEALANVYSEGQTMEVDGEKPHPNTGYSVSFGGGMANSCYAMRGKSLVEFSTTRCGDHIDRQASMVTGEPVGKVIRVKERQLDLDRQQAEDDPARNVLEALSVYYDEMIARVARTMSREMTRRGGTFEGPVEVVLCGGTAMARGFVGRFEKALARVEMPFRTKSVRLSKSPFFSVSQGCALAAAADQKKKDGNKT